jgi:hypothetical protein
MDGGEGGQEGLFTEMIGTQTVESKYVAHELKVQRGEGKAA